VTTGEIPDQRVPTAKIARTGHLLKPAHGPNPSFEMLMVTFEAVVEVFRGSVLHLRQQRL
jgi:hypothetical protein